MPNPLSFRYFKTSPEIIQLAVMLYVRFPRLGRGKSLVQHLCKILLPLPMPLQFSAKQVMQRDENEIYVFILCVLEGFRP